jgi:hypothetical protein
MLWALISRPLTAMLTLAGVALLSPVLVPLTAALIKPLVKPVANLYLDVAEEIGEVMEERERLKASTAAKGKKVSKKPRGDEEAKEIEAGTVVLDQVGKLL